MERKIKLSFIKTKILMIVISMLFSIPSIVKGYSYNNYNSTYDNGNKLVYGITKVNVTASNISFKGWAYINEIHTIGGKNNKISMLAMTEYDYLNGNHSNYVEVTSSDYDLENAIYPTTCYRAGGADNCGEVHYGYNKGGARPYASCNGSDTSCIHYDAGFDITFSINQLKSRLSLDETDRVVFIIKILYEKLNNLDGDGRIKVVNGGGSGCRFDTSDGKYKGCSISLDDAHSYQRKRVVAFHESVMTNNGTEFDKIVNAKYDTKFINVTNRGKIHDYYGGAMHGTSQNYFAYKSSQGNEFNISGSVMYGLGDSNLGIPSTDFRWFALNTSSNYTHTEGGFYYYTSGTTIRYAPSTWGIVNGEVFLGFSSTEPPPTDSCWEYTKQDSFSATKCENVYYRSICNKIVSITQLETFDLNGVGCKSGEKGTIKAYKVYETDELTEIIKDDLFTMGTGRKVWPGIKWDQPIEWLINRTVKWKYFDEEYKIYYQATRYYDSDPGTGVTCVKEGEEGAWVKEEYLRSKGSAEINNYLNNAKTRLDAEIDKMAIDKWEAASRSYSDNRIRSVSLNNRMLKLGFPKSDKYVPDSYYVDTNSIIKVSQEELRNDSINNEFYAEEKFEIKNAWIKDTDVIYSDTNPGGYLDGGNYYYFPFDVPSGTELKFGFGIDFKSLVRDMSTTPYDTDAERLVVWCKLPIDEGNLETKNYRVIDLSNPFPNNVPSKVANKAVNWEGFWNNQIKGNLNYLYDRIDSTSPLYQKELYTVELSSDNIDRVREFNYKELYDLVGKPRRTYINTILDLDGSSKFIKNFSDMFTNNGMNNNKSGIGESGVDTP